MKLVIIESPYAGYVNRNREYLNQCIRDSLSRGEAPFASHKMYTDSLDDEVFDERCQGMVAGFSWMMKADKVVVYDDYGVSIGMKKGIAMADYYDKPVEYRRIL